MRSFVDGLSYRQIFSSLANISTIFPPELQLNIDDVPSTSTIKRCFVHLSIKVKIDAAEKLKHTGPLMSSCDESPDPKGRPTFVSCIKNLKTGENLITGLQRIAAKRSTDSLRAETNILRILHTAFEDNSFDFKKDFLQRLVIRGGDGCPTEMAYHKLLEKERSARSKEKEAILGEAETIFPRIVCALHANNTLLRHLEKALKDDSIVFKYVRLIAKHIGSRSTKNAREEFDTYLGMHNVPKSNIIGLTGVRFNEVIRNVAELARLFDNVSDFILYQPKDSLLRKEF